MNSWKTHSVSQHTCISKMFQYDISHPLPKKPERVSFGFALLSTSLLFMNKTLTFSLYFHFPALSSEYEWLQEPFETPQPITNHRAFIHNLHILSHQEYAVSVLCSHIYFFLSSNFNERLNHTLMISGFLQGSGVGWVLMCSKAHMNYWSIFLLLFTFCETTINAPLSHQYVFTYSLLYYRFDLLYKNKQTK